MSAAAGQATMKNFSSAKHPVRAPSMHFHSACRSEGMYQCTASDRRGLATTCRARSSKCSGGSGTAAAAGVCAAPAGLVTRQQQQQRRRQRWRGGRCIVSSAAEAGPAGPSPPPPPGPMTEEELRQLAAREDAARDEALGDAWRSVMDGSGGVAGLYDYVERDEAEWVSRVAEAMSVPRAMRERRGAFLGLDGLPPGMATDLIGMGSWRLRNSVDSVIGLLVGRLEGALRELLEDDLALYPPAKWKDQGWDYLDSLDPDRTLDGWSHADAANPVPGEDGYPRLQVENRVYCSRAFRKLHLEVAVRQDGLQVLHVVWYPRYDFDMPIFALDLVIANGTATLAVADACPLARDLSLPRHYHATLRELQEAHLGDEPATSRAVPEWGRSIFSPLAVCMRPSGGAALSGFVKYAVAAARAHLMYASLLSPVDARTKAGARRLADLAAGHERFVANQLSNRKTARVLEAAFGVERSDAYMRGLMFDYDPADSPPWFDGSLSRLYRHFDRAPEPWADGKQLLAIRRGIDADKARVFLDRFMAGETSIAGERLQFALAALYDADPEFRAGIDASMPDVAELRRTAPGAVGARLEAELLALLREANGGDDIVSSSAAGGKGDSAGDADDKGGKDDKQRASSKGGKK